MPQIERLYGVEHGVEETDFFLRKRSKALYPSAKLIEHLKGLLPGAKVGIETFREVFKPTDLSDADKISELNKLTTLAQHEYWRCLVDLCESLDLEIVFLDDLDTWLNYSKKIEESARLKNRLSIHYNYEAEPLGTEEERKQWKEDIYRLQAEADYIFIFGREEKIIENISVSAPQVVIVGVSHGDVFFLGQPLANKDIIIASYWQETKGRLIDEPVISDDVLVHRELIKRRYHAVTAKRVMPDKIPDFIGTYSLGMPVRGLFEIYLIDPETFEGICHDCDGTGSVKGSFEAGQVKFSKVYEKKWTKESPLRRTRALEGTLSYTATNKPDGSFVGHWKSDRERGSFIMWPGDKLGEI